MVACHAGVKYSVNGRENLGEDRPLWPAVRCIAANRHGDNALEGQQAWARQIVIAPMTATIHDSDVWWPSVQVHEKRR